MSMLRIQLSLRIIQASLFVLAPAVGLSAQVPTPAHFVDARGTFMGQVYDLGGPSTTLAVNGVVVAVVVFRDHLQHVLGSHLVYFAGPGCTGAAYTTLPTASAELHPPAAIVGPANSLYLGEATAPQSISYASLLIPGDPVCREDSGSASGVVPVALVMDLSPHFQPPFSMVPSLAAPQVPAAETWALAALAACLAAAATMLLMRRRTAA